jgi:RNA polymerase sigma factor (sigma-70 family)
LRSPAFNDACDSFDPSAGSQFVEHLLSCAEPRIKDSTPGPLWSWFDVGWIARWGSQDAATVDVMSRWIQSLSDSFTQGEAEDIWVEFWIRRSSAAVRAFDGTGVFFDHVKQWAANVEHRVLCQTARSWTPLERELVVRWLMSTGLKRLVLAAIRSGVPAQEVEDALNDFWITQDFHGTKGVLTNYVPAADQPCAGRFLAFFTTALRHRCRALVEDLDRSAKFERPLVVTDESGDSQFMIEPVATERPPDEEVIRREYLRKASSLIAGFPASERAVLQLFVRGYDNSAIARTLNISQGAVRVYLFRGLKRLRASLSGGAAGHERWSVALGG